MNKDYKIFLKHILENIKDIEDFSKGLSETKIKENILKQKAIIRSLEIIGEAVKNIPAKIKKENPEVKWLSIAGLRDKLIHHYFGVDLNLVWKVIQKDLSIFKKQVEVMLK